MTFPVNEPAATPAPLDTTTGSLDSVVSQHTAFRHDIGNLLHIINALGGAAEAVGRKDLAEAIDRMNTCYSAREYEAIRPILEQFGSDLAALSDDPGTTACTVSFVLHIIGTRRMETFEPAVFEEWIKLRYYRYFREESPRKITVTSATDIPVQIDRGGLLRVAKNLINNALEGRDGKSAKNIWLLSSLIQCERDIYLELKVRDDGPGIPDDVLEHLLEPGRKSKITDGVGYPIIAGIVRELGGSLEVISRPVEGGCRRLRPGGVIDSRPDTETARGTITTVRLPIGGDLSPGKQTRVFGG